MFTLSVEDTFSSAHQLRGYQGNCEKIHGHNWRVILSVSGEKLDKIGLLIDFRELKNILGTICKILDHTNLNEISPFDTLNPSSENLAQFFAERAADALHRISHDLKIESVTIYESEGACCTFVPGKG
jgi:6-pyruvoyltetrahydropterin/6-carboxytetrahydropterin synthase